MLTPIGEYLNKLNANKSKIATAAKIKGPRMNDLCNDETAKPYADEFFPLLYLANFYAGIPNSKFDEAVSEIFPNRKKGLLIEQFKNLSPSARLFLTYTQSKQQLEKSIGMPKNKISKFKNPKTNRATALEVINFCDGMNFDLLATYENTFGKITV
ncbi:hypothetical protein [Sphingobacterium pedocola]|uniref:Uncharacterized protein n=1 Tax=Sphingobacterium pedocola TaxID=2082722 RepID=A0ABR9T964_9SPHI|nr:hypothetical protein [Sphingobacterium pedocola]MBE8721177.1 hypothetical protein [Sphingobacterium pedocola]